MLMWVVTRVLLCSCYCYRRQTKS